MRVGTDETRLIVLRGNSGSGKSAVATALRSSCDCRIAWVSQDLVRRTILQEKDRPGGANIGMIDQLARYSLDHGYNVVLDGIFRADRYEQMLARLRHDHAGYSFFYYFDVSFAETLRRHSSRPQAAEFGLDDMRTWFRPLDLLTSIEERVISECSSLQETVGRVLADCGLQPRPRSREARALASGLAAPIPRRRTAPRRTGGSSRVLRRFWSR